MYVGAIELGHETATAEGSLELCVCIYTYIYDHEMICMWVLQNWGRKEPLQKAVQNYAPRVVQECVYIHIYI